MHGMKAYGEVVVLLHWILTFVPIPLYPVRRSLQSVCTFWKREKFLASVGIRTMIPQMPRPYSSHYTNLAIPAAVWRWVAALRWLDRWHWVCLCWRWAEIRWRSRTLVRECVFTRLEGDRVGVLPQSKTSFLGAFAKLRKATLTFIMCVLYLPGSHWTDFHEILYLSIFRKSVEKTYVWLESDKTSGYFAWRRFHIYDSISLNCPYNERCFR